jgi:hypothetical protein
MELGLDERVTAKFRVLALEAELEPALSYKMSAWAGRAQVRKALRRSREARERMAI